MTELLNGAPVWRIPDSKLYNTNPAVDAFQRLRVSNVATLGDYQLQYDTHPLYWYESVTNTSGNAATAHNANQSSVNLKAEAEDVVIRQSRLYHRYQPGKSQLIFCTFTLAALTTGVTQRVGYFDTDNGIFLEAAGAAMRFVRRTKTSGTATDAAHAQADWNLDVMDGSGPSGVTLDWTKAQILAIDLEWLGVGRVRLGFVINGQIIYTHEINNANSVTAVYMSTANLPIRYEIRAAAGVAGAHTLVQICSQVSSEGGFAEETGLQFSTNLAGTAKSVTTRVPILSIRPKAEFASVVNRGAIIPQTVNIAALSKVALIEIVYGGALTDASYASVGDYSITERDVTATAITGGVTVASFYVPAAAQGTSRSPGSGAASILGRAPLALDIAGTHPTAPLSDVFSIVATTGETPSATSVYAALVWRELR